MRQWLLLPPNIIVCDICKALVQACKTAKSDSKPQNSNSNEQSSPEPLVVPKLEKGLCCDEMDCHTINYVFSLSPSELQESQTQWWTTTKVLYLPPLPICSLMQLCASIRLYVTCIATCMRITPTHIFQHQGFRIIPGESNSQVFTVWLEYTFMYHINNTNVTRKICTYSI